ncbi:Panacea domain-containing protein [Chloroflexota bacterium]
MVELRPDPSNVLQNAITYLCFKTKTLSQTKLMKLVYLADAYHMERFGERLTNVPFKHWHYGPFSEEINEEIERLCGMGILKQKSYQTRAGFMAEVPKPAIHKTSAELSDEALTTLDEIIEEWGDSSTEEVVTFAKTSMPFVGTPFGDEINFNRVDIVKETAEVNNISIEDAATLLIENDKDLIETLDKAQDRAHSLP